MCHPFRAQDIAATPETCEYNQCAIPSHGARNTDGSRVLLQLSLKALGQEHGH